jgi:hypothetical protein
MCSLHFVWRTGIIDVIRHMQSLSAALRVGSSQRAHYQLESAEWVSAVWAHEPHSTDVRHMVTLMARSSLCIICSGPLFDFVSLCATLCHSLSLLLLGFPPSLCRPSTALRSVVLPEVAPLQ